MSERTLIMNKITLLILALTSTLSYSQYIENLTYGLKVGGVRSQFSNLPEMVMGREHTLKQFDLTSKAKFGVEGGVFLNYKFPDTRTAIQSELLYRQAGAKVQYSQPSSGENYELDFNYSYLVLGATYRLYPLRGFNLGVGAFYAKNLSPNNLSYSSNVQGGLYDTEYRQFYRDGIVGKDNFSLAFSLGYEFENGFHIDARYDLGLSDAIGNRTTSFQFLENHNRQSLLSLSVGYSFHQW